jgi:hypothetical protein
VRLRLLLVDPALCGEPLRLCRDPVQPKGQQRQEIPVNSPNTGEENVSHAALVVPLQARKEREVHTERMTGWIPSSPFEQEMGGGREIETDTYGDRYMDR